MDTDTSSATPSQPRKHQTTHTDTQGTPRMSRRKSRSSSRRAPSVSASGRTPTSPDLDDGEYVLKETWHIEQNNHCNGGLKNAVDSVSDRLRKKLWVGTLGSHTDEFGTELRKDIDDRMYTNHNSLPVWIPDAEFQSCYAEFCHQVCVQIRPISRWLSSVRSFGHACIMPFPTLPRPSCSTSRRPSSSTLPSISASPTRSSPTIRRATSVSGI